MPKREGLSEFKEMVEDWREATKKKGIPKKIHFQPRPWRITVRDILISKGEQKWLIF